MRAFIFFIFCFVALTCGEIFFHARPCHAQNWSEVKDEHFVVFYSSPEDSSWAQRVLRKAEEYYDKIASQIGYSRYSNFWTWNERVKIIVFENQLTYLEKTGQPQWSNGYSNRDSRLFTSRVIVTFFQQEDFLTGLLPHEISHLILRDFIGFERDIPIWFDEGVAQFYEEDKKDKANDLMNKLVSQNQFIPLSVLKDLDIREETDSRKVSIFYLQSVSLVDFLLKNYGARAFSELCRNLKEGQDMDSAIHNAYSGSIESMEKLEEKWIKSTRNTRGLR